MKDASCRNHVPHVIVRRGTGPAVIHGVKAAPTPVLTLVKVTQSGLKVRRQAKVKLTVKVSLRDGLATCQLTPPAPVQPPAQRTRHVIVKPPTAYRPHPAQATPTPTKQPAPTQQPTDSRRRSPRPPVITAQPARHIPPPDATTSSHRRTPPTPPPNRRSRPTTRRAREVRTSRSK